MKTKNKIILGILVLSVVTILFFSGIPKKDISLFSKDSEKKISFFNTKQLDSIKQNSFYLDDKEYLMPISESSLTSEWIDDSKSYINITPKNLIGSGWIYVNFKSKEYLGNMTLAFGIDEKESEIQITQIEIYEPHNITQEFICPEDAELTIDKQYYTCLIKDLNSMGDYQFKVEYLSAYEKNRSAYWLEEVEWKSLPLNKKGITTSKTIPESDKWFYQKDIPINSNKEYKFRFYVQIESNLGENKQVKYNLAFYPSSYNTDIKNALIEDKFYYIDPTINTTANVGAWKFDETSGTNANDEVYNNDGTASNARMFTTNYTGKQNTSIDFTGGNDYLTIPHTANVSGTTMSYSFWFKGATTTGTLPALQVVLFKATDTGYNREISFEFQTDKKITVQAFRTSPNTAESIITDSAHYDTNWHHYVAIRDINDSKTRLTIYKDGDLIGQKTLSYLANTNTAQYTVGAAMTKLSPATYNYYLNGYIDELYIFNTNLSEADAEALYNAGAGFFYPFEDDEEPANTTCNYTSSNWVVNCSENCLISSNVNLMKNNISFYNNGSFNVEANISNFTQINLPYGCKINLKDGNYLTK